MSAASAMRRPQALPPTFFGVEAAVGAAFALAAAYLEMGPDDDITDEQVAAIADRFGGEATKFALRSAGDLLLARAKVLCRQSLKKGKL